MSKKHSFQDKYDDEQAAEAQVPRDDEQETYGQELIEIQPVAKAVATVGSLSRHLIKLAHEQNKSLTNEDLAIKVVKYFLDAGVVVKTSAACIAWYKSDMRKKGQLTGGKNSRKSIELDIASIEL